uniref:Hypoxanthine phosphoribosyltransferase n=1 Tax=Chrysotila carterae TaxID=13221 RepID=A0A7S4B1C2_CHRCT
MSTAMAAASKPIHIPDNFEGYDLEQFVIPEHYAADLCHTLIPHGFIQSRTQKVAADIFKAYDFGAGEKVHMLCVLKGGHEFFSDLITYLKRYLVLGCKHVPIAFDFIRVKSYQGTESNCKPTIEATGVDLGALKDHHVLIVEDIIDTGHTMSLLVPYLKEQGAASVRVAALLQKRTDKSVGYVGDFVGFSIPDRFVVGYCLDYNEIYRDMDHICVLNAAGINKHAAP